MGKPDSRLQQITGLFHKIRWALYEKRKFDRLIANVIDFVDKRCPTKISDASTIHCSSKLGHVATFCEIGEEAKVWIGDDNMDGVGGNSHLV